MKDLKFVVYYRVSTKRQGKSGLGLDAQRKIVAHFIKRNDAVAIAEFTEIESGKINDRPALKNALEYAKKWKAKLLVAKLDRLARNLHFITSLQNSNVDFICADVPHANKLTIQLLAAVAENERENISQRTRDGLQAAKARGRKLGANNPKIRKAIDRYLKKSRYKKPTPSKDKYASLLFATKIVKNLVQPLHRNKKMTYKAIVQHLNEIGHTPLNGGLWTETKLHRARKYHTQYLAMESARRKKSVMKVLADNV